MTYYTGLIYSLRYQVLKHFLGLFNHIQNQKCSLPSLPLPFFPTSPHQQMEASKDRINEEQDILHY